MQWTRSLGLIACLAFGSTQAAPFYADKTLAHPLITGLAESSATLAFIKQAGSVKGYYSVDPDESQPQLLDDFGDATIESVFNIALDNESLTRLVLFKQRGQYRVHAYRYDENDRLYRRLEKLQPALERIAKDRKKLDAPTVKQALRQLTPLNYSVFYEDSGIDEFDQLDHSAGTLVGYFDANGQPITANPPGADQYRYKKTFVEKDGRFLTATYWRGEAPALEGEPLLYNYRASHIAWETEPQRFTGSEDGAYVEYSSFGGAVIAQGAYAHGQRTGEWSFSNPDDGWTHGRFVDGKRQGQWTESYGWQTATGEYRDDLREGRWVLSYDEGGESAVTGFQTYVQGVLDGPSEERVDGSTESGSYRNDKREGPWVTQAGRGNFENGLKSGPWILKTDKGHNQSVNFVADKKDGELRETDANGVLVLIEHYKADVLSGTREGYSPSGNLQYSQQYENGKREGRSLGYSEDGKLISDISWHNDRYEGPHLTFLRDGTPATVGRFEGGRFVGLMKQYDQDEVLYEEANWCRFDKRGSTVERCGKQRRFTHGKLSWETDFLFGSPQGSIEYNYETGQKIREKIIGDNDQITQRTYYDNGQVECQKNSVGFTWMTINQQQVKSHESDGQLTGEQLCYHRNGAIKSRELIDNGLSACRIVYDESGKRLSSSPTDCGAPATAAAGQ
ncbi:hypothetical protein C4K19_0461 [Pseudomonas chlororaphis subsp. aurantiaca]|uniref:toxin-antitoxin system YwqK family antitoxin n=1 Tax=Pseudomonas chlororaphis TaxID=587753 RepID=UPI000F588DD2|nr:hypothetical protein [Pseudomonas chlororaphis]AZD52277.1 hypothetical protein C4K19_0461 [Pseudomonas chlororaphis subsp. aurantiaca]